MAITPTDLRFFAAQYPTDDAYGGGPMSVNIVLDGVSKNLFPMIGEQDAAIGRTQLRKFYPAVLSANTDILINAAAGEWTPPADAQVEVALFAWGDAKTTRSDAGAALASLPFSYEPGTSAGAPGAAVGDLLVAGDSAGGILTQTIQVIGIVTNLSPFTYSRIYDPTGGAVLTIRPAVPSPAAPKCCGTASLTAASGSASVTVNSLWARVVPNIAPYPSAPQGIVSTALRLTNGLVPIFRAGESVVLRNAAGTTSELAVIQSVNYVTNVITFTSPLANSYASGSRVSSLASLGDLQARAGSSFSQQTWTRVFSDTIIGSPIGANYNRSTGVIALTNEGAETERWAFVFTSATDFKLVGETYGQIATGTVGTNFSPINPATSQPFFTIPAAGWGTGWAVGNVLRLNTKGARAPLWASRCISPGASLSTDSTVLQFRGSY